MKLLPSANYLVLLFTLTFTLLFYDKLIGINLFIFESVCFSVAFLLYKPKFSSLLSKVLIIGTLLSLVMVVVHNTLIAKWVNIISFLLLLGSIECYELKTIKSYFLQLYYSMFYGTKSFGKDYYQTGNKKIRVIKTLQIIAIPIAVIFLFFILYYLSNEKFAGLSDSFFSKIGELLNWLPSLKFTFFLTIFVGLLITILLFYPKKDRKLISSESSRSDDMARKRIPMTNKNLLALKYEYKSGVFLLVVLNIMLLVFNYSDITTVWFSFQWNGEYLKDFVHLGTYLLIISLIVSILIVLYYFRGNLNFYKENKWLKGLTYLWLGQNLVVVVSLIIRNTIYINHFSLAYKRIGVYVFIIAVVVGLVSIIIKVSEKKSLDFVINRNTFSIYGLFVLLTFVNWDVFIAKYNLDSYDKSFIELNFLSELSDKALPYINLDHEKLNQLETQQSQSFKFSSRSYYMSKTTYKEKIENKIDYFIDSYPSRSWLEWNYAEHKAYYLLKNKD